MPRYPSFNHAGSGLRVRFRHEGFDWPVLKLGGGRECMKGPMR